MSTNTLEVPRDKAAGGAQRRDPSRMKILLVEDNVIDMQFATSTLDSLGYPVDTAGNGVQAVEAVRRQRYDVILMDVRMPEMDGIEATKTIRRLSPPDAQPYIIALTATVMREDWQCCVDAGMNAFVPKPYTPTELTEALEAALSNAPRIEAQRDAATANTNASPTLLIDLEHVREVIELICEGEPAAFDRWIGYLESDLNKFETLLPGAGTTESNASIQGAAHSLKGTCLTMGAKALGVFFAEIERDAKAGKSAAFNQRYAEGRELEARSLHALREVAAKGSGDS